ncbi:Anthocyanin 3'-O-beta-glucosyltransferase [Hibiscus syriacus]|uniref:Glycosyltransferase n=1 Tax=Hibiscus syriacus TaxID=106335 RepID=A0A6A2ZIU2_HIBSY|nr:Anthocyanin 3'-O-beta-glucosyltransferase [Hibiscus syriacus]
MDSKPNPLRILFFPHLAHGHMIPTVDMARLFARQGVKATILSTQLNVPFFSKTIERDRELGFEIDVLVIKFPSMEAGLPEGIEVISSITSQEMGFKFFKAVSLLQQPLQRILEDCRPDCLVADGMFPWGYGCCKEGWGTKAVPGIPDKITMTRRQQPTELRESGANVEITNTTEKPWVTRRQQPTELRESGANVEITFPRTGTTYVEHYRKTLGRKSWHIGPLSLCNNNTEDKSQRGNANDASIDRVKFLRWLDSKKHNSVLYICFGSVSWISAAQLNEIAKGIEESGLDFLWVLRKTNKDEDEWLPKGFDERMKGKGWIIRGWAPQVLILDHEAIGGFMTHCGWNSTLEGITAGVPMVTWPLSNEQFINEKFITDILRVGVGVGAQEWSRWMEGKKLLVTKENVTKAITEVMLGEEANNIRNRVSALKWMAKRAVEECGSSHSDLMALLDGLGLNSI